MSYRKFNGDNLFDGYHFLGEGQVLITDKAGKIDGIVRLADAGDNVEKFAGIISPGLINCHCHLELSHLKNVIPPHTGLIDFLCSVVTKRGFAPEIVREEIIKGEREMYDNGIVAVGDIGNTADTAITKAGSRIRWQNFVEVLSFTDDRAEVTVAQYLEVLGEFEKVRQSMPGQSVHNIQRSSLVPHAPYSISPKTFEMINEATPGQIISIHNQEHPAEDELYKTGGGEYLRLFKIFGMDKSPFPVTKKSSLQSYLPYFKNGQTIFLIHNTFMPEEDIVFANGYAEKHGLHLVYCLCPNANSYIENKLPVVGNFVKHACHVVLGTDSYSSNWQLSIIKEVQTLHDKFPDTPLDQIFRWATSDGAKALQWDQELGSFEKGKIPGVVLIEADLSASKRLL